MGTIRINLCHISIHSSNIRSSSLMDQPHLNHMEWAPDKKEQFLNQNKGDGMMSWQKNCMFTHIYKSTLKNHVTIYKCIALISSFCSAIYLK